MRIIHSAMEHRISYPGALGPWLPFPFVFRQLNYTESPSSPGLFSRKLSLQTLGPSQSVPGPCDTSPVFSQKTNPSQGSSLGSQ